MLGNVFTFISEFWFYFPCPKSRQEQTSRECLVIRQIRQKELFPRILWQFQCVFQVKPSLLVCVCVCVSIIRWSGLDKLKFCILFSWIDCHDCRALEIFADFSFERPKRFRLRSLARKAITQWGATTTKTSFEKNVCVRYSNVTFQLFSESLRL